MQYSYFYISQAASLPSVAVAETKPVNGDREREKKKGIQRRFWQLQLHVAYRCSLLEKWQRYVPGDVVFNNSNKKSNNHLVYHRTPERKRLRQNGAKAQGSNKKSENEIYISLSVCLLEALVGRNVTEGFVVVFSRYYSRHVQQAKKTTTLLL